MKNFILLKCLYINGLYIFEIAIFRDSRGGVEDLIKESWRNTSTKKSEIICSKDIRQLNVNML